MNGEFWPACTQLHSVMNFFFRKDYITDMTLSFCNFMCGQLIMNFSDNAAFPLFSKSSFGLIIHYMLTWVRVSQSILHFKWPKGLEELGNGRT